MSFAEKIDDLIAESGLTQNELANKLEISPSYLSQMRNGHKDSVNIYYLMNICEYFNVSLDWLLDRPGAVKSTNIDNANRIAAGYTGLSSEAIEKLHRYNCSKEKESLKIRNTKDNSNQKALPFDMYFRLTTLTLINKLITEFDNEISYNLSEYNDNLYYTAEFLESVLLNRNSLISSQQVGFDWNDEGKTWQYIPAGFNSDYSHTEYEDYQDRQKRYLDTLVEIFKNIIIGSSPYTDYITKLNNEIDTVNSYLNEQAEKYYKENN